MTPSVLDLIVQRVKEKSQPKKRQDQYKLGLVIEGGAMRSVVSAGMVTALQALGIIDCFDSVYSTSGGSCVSAYFLSGQTPKGTAIYYTYANTKKFINPLRFLIGKPIMDLDYIVNKVMKELVPLDVKKILGRGVIDNIFVTETRGLKLVNLHNFKNEDEFFQALRYTCNIPIVSGWPSRVSENVYFTDGTIRAGAMPIQCAIRDSCSHILVLPSRPLGSSTHQKSLLEFLVIRILTPRFPKLAQHLRDRFKLYLEEVHEIYQSEDGLMEFPKIEAVHLPRGNKEIDGAEYRRDILIKGAKEGFKAVIEKFRSYHLDIDPTIHIIE